MKSITDVYRLANGVGIPCIGFGTLQIANGETAVKVVLQALITGYRHIDTAQGYANEESVGMAVKKSDIPRDEIFITSKLTNDMHGYENTMKAFEETMLKLDTGYLDLFLIHWPNPIKNRNNWAEANAGSWKAFEELYQSGRIRAIGISNFREHHIEALMKTAKIQPMVNQIRLCPGETQDELVEYCKNKGILLEAYSPLGVGAALEVPELMKIAKKHGKSTAQISIRWSLQRGFLPLPKTETPSRMKENIEVFDFVLSDDEMGIISGLKDCCGHSDDPDTITF